jgi:hypothetical protein
MLTKHYREMQRQATVVTVKSTSTNQPVKKETSTSKK